MAQLSAKTLGTHCDWLEFHFFANPYRLSVFRVMGSVFEQSFRNTLRTLAFYITFEGWFGVHFFVNPYRLSGFCVKGQVLDQSLGNTLRS